MLRELKHSINNVYCRLDLCRDEHPAKIQAIFDHAVFHWLLIVNHRIEGRYGAKPTVKIFVVHGCLAANGRTGFPITHQKTAFEFRSNHTMLRQLARNTPRITAELGRASNSAFRGKAGSCGGLLTKPSAKVTFSRNSSIIAVHRDIKEDHQNLPFEFNEENLARAKEIIAKYPPQYKKGACMPLLDLGQRQLGFTSISVMNYVAKLLDMPPMRVYEVATFYTMYMRKPMGKYNLQVCTTTPCQLCGSDEIMKAVTDFLKIKPGQTTPDKMFTLQEVECLGACVNAPMMAIDDDFHEDLTAEKTVAILKKLQEGKTLETIGPVSGRHSCEPFSGRKVLLSETPNDMRNHTRADL